MNNNQNRFNVKTIIKYVLAICISVVLLYFTKLGYNFFFGTKAANGTANVFLQPATKEIPPDGFFFIWVTADRPVAFANVEINFDSTLLKLTQDVNIANSPLTRIVKKTSLTEANASGKIQLTLALDPSNKANPPTGTFQLATLQFASNTQNPNIDTGITFNNQVNQLVDIDKSVFTVTTSGVSIKINVATPVPTSTPTVTPTATPTSTPIVATMPAQTPTPTPVPTSTPTPTGIPTSGVILSPAADTFVYASKPSSNFGTGSYLEVDGSPKKIIYFKFDLSSLSGKIISKATLKVKVKDGSSSYQNIKEVVDVTWNEYIITYYNRPALSTTPILTFKGGSLGSFKEFDLTSFLTGKEGKIVSFAFDSTGSNGLDFYSKEYRTSASRPQLIISTY